MHDQSRLFSRRSAALCLVGGLVGVVLSGPVLAEAQQKEAAHAAKPPLVAGWAAALEHRALEIQNAPKAQATRIGYGAVVKKDDGGMVETVAAAVEVPVADQAPTLPGLAPVEPAPPVVFSVRSPLADRVGRVARRLIELGHLPADQWTDKFDDNVENAVRAFQTAEGLQPDGKVGEVTRQALDRTPAQTVALLRRAAAAMRAQQASIPDTTVLVNLPAQSVTLIDRGRPAFTMRAVVGRPSRKTPLLQDKITSVTINPTWTVPPTVLSEDKLPALRKKGTTGIKNAVVYLDGAEVVTQSINWWSVDPGRIRIVQKPGDDNALGRFRFNLTNGDGIFLHGTNDPKLFSRDLRAASSGCVRLEDARLMAETLLSAAKLTPSGIGQQLDTGETKTIRLPNAIPVRFVYWNASVDTSGTVRVHPDIYEDPPSTPAPAAPSSVPSPTGAVSTNGSAAPVTPVSTLRPLSKPAPLPVPAAQAPNTLSSASVPAVAKPVPAPTRM
ncbi:L,D-transpeptidase family protein [Azospirillum sp. TSO35-2]|uniref:L,D-transpeptidase family protein n=1 Tax=Azospirillum sp. TSO35-2 TaxID=716796 RepID=UPI000D60C97E|nr:L,D-transpeptidase family protein [Azospirillum sp. TSO35-2]PWC36514.1 hypothetical protein TSO352_15695 [Azospirillum sp. TSO35-2]